MSVSAAFLQYVLEQLERTGPLRTRRMFGAVGLYCDDHFFGIIDDDTLFMKVDDSTRADYEARGAKPFCPYKDRPEVSMTYYTVPADILDDAEELVTWARRSVTVAANSALRKKHVSPSLPVARRLKASSRGPRASAAKPKSPKKPSRPR